MGDHGVYLGFHFCIPFYRMNRTLPFIALSLLTLSACSFRSTPNEPVPTVTPSSSSQAMPPETKNVLYRGVLEKQGVSIFMEGTHRLRLEDGRFVLLSSETVDLGEYIGMNVEVFGAVRPTVEQGGLIMRVERVTSLASSSSSSSTPPVAFCGGFGGFACPDDLTCIDDPNDSCDPMNGGADCGGICVDASSSSSAKEESSSSVAVVEKSSTPVVVASSKSSKSSTSSNSSISSVAAAPASTPSNYQASGELSAKAAVMAKDKMGAENWTQQYCSTHMGFCFPVHRNWWFKSFGATSSTFWHIEIGPSEMNNLGEGPLTVDVVSGNTTSDGTVTVQGDTVVGIRAWTGGRHIEVRAPANLEAAVRYLTEQIKASQN